MSLHDERSEVAGRTCNRDIDWRVEQKLARVLAERDLYWRGVSDGFWIVAVVVGLAIMFWPEIRAVTKVKH